MSEPIKLDPSEIQRLKELRMKYEQLRKEVSETKDEFTSPREDKMDNMIENAVGRWGRVGALTPNNQLNAELSPTPEGPCLLSHVAINENAINELRKLVDGGFREVFQRLDRIEKVIGL